MDEKILRATERTGVIGRGEFDKFRKVYGAEWDDYRTKYDEAANLIYQEFPIQIDFELNASCNLRCGMCPISAESNKGKGKKTWFEFSAYKEIIDFVVKKGTRSIKLNYINEPLIRKDLPEFIKYAKDSGIIDIYLSTNGILLTREFSQQLIDVGITRIQISIDATTSDVYEKMRPGGDFDVLIENINSFLALRKSSGSEFPLVRVNFVKTETNSQQLADFIRQWEGVVDMVGIQEYIKPPNQVDDKKSKIATGDKSDFRCSFPFKQLVITNEKKILPCCTFWGEEMPLGIYKSNKDLEKAWNCSEMNELRDLHSEGKYFMNKICKRCVDGQ